MPEPKDKYGWPSFVEFKRDMFSLFKEYFTDMERDIKIIKESLTNHLTDEHKELNVSLKNIDEKLDKLLNK